MQSLAIIKPTTFAQAKGAGSATTESAIRALRDDPKEAWFIPSNSSATFHILSLDAGALIAFDALFVGYHTAPAGVNVALALTDGYDGPITSRPIPDTALLQPALGAPFHFFQKFEPMTARYMAVVIVVPANTPAFVVGNVVIGRSWQAQWGTEWGAGRPIEDTGTAERLFGGGFAIDDGVAAGGYSWTFGDLQPDEVPTLYRLVKDRRTTRSVLVVEDPEQTDGLNERIHWGLFGKLDAYERLDPMNTKWALQIRDWA